MAVKRTHDRDACERAAVGLSAADRGKQRANEKRCDNDAKPTMVHDRIVLEDDTSICDRDPSKSAITLVPLAKRLDVPA
jgi:hypothetical protein